MLFSTFYAAFLYLLYGPCVMSVSSAPWLPIVEVKRKEFILNFLMFKLVLEKAEEPETKLPTSAGSSKNQESSRKISTSFLLTMSKPLTMWTTTNSGKSSKRWEYQTTWPASWEICMQVRKQQLELDMKQTGSKWGKEYFKAVYYHPAYLTSMQSTSL